MGLLTDHTALEVVAPGDAAALRDVLSLIGSIDGNVDAQERAVIEAFFKTIPQLRDEAINLPPRSGKGAILAALTRLESPRLKRQCFVLAVELAMASGGVNEAEDQWLDTLSSTLAVEPAFALAVVQVLACKYAREPSL